MLPDPKLTPGKVAARAADTRGVTSEMRAQVFDRYRISYEDRNRYIIDHLIPKELGGADSLENLWPQSLHARPYNPRRKQLLASTLAKLVAEGRLTLAQAQAEMRDDWISSFVRRIGMVYLTPSLEPQRD